MTIVIPSQVRGGKNNICITRTGRRFPNKKWAAWRDVTVEQVKEQLPIWHEPISTRKAFWEFIYTPENMLRRDAPAVLDSVMHCFEKAGLVTDDCLIKNFKFIEMEPNKENPSMVVNISLP
jgi:hypothetical protein